MTSYQFVPFAFIVEEAISKGMSAYMAQYLVPILNAARSVTFSPSCFPMYVTDNQSKPLRPDRSQRHRRQSRPLQRDDRHVLYNLHRHPSSLDPRHQQRRPHLLCCIVRYRLRRRYWPHTRPSALAISDQGYRRAVRHGVRDRVDCSSNGEPDRWSNHQRFALLRSGIVRSLPGLVVL